ncbi:MAG TPA: hypothetical protein VM537_18340 [Anaerolineae bacterium]|nr:hypothetical protein [Anaerolineae bacterium]
MNTKAERVEAARLAQLRAFCPEIFGKGTLLYVGASPRRSQFLPQLLAAGRDVTLLEIWPANAEHFRGWPGVQVVCGDVCAVEGLILPEERYDVAFWWHGPEHIPGSDLHRAMAGLERRARQVVVGCPWGVSRQATVDGNPHQQHVTTLHPENFVALGYRVNIIGKVNSGSRSNILAVKP